MMNTQVTNIAGRECHLFIQNDAPYLLIQPVDEHDLNLLEKEVGKIRELSDANFSLVAYKIMEWQNELTPWSAPPVFGSEPFGEGAADTLSYITEQLLPALHSMAMDVSHVILGGYSLAGLFSLWAAYQTNSFEGVVAASPSVWYPGWIDYAMVNRPLSEVIYLSLGDKEEKTKNRQMAQVGNAIRKQNDLLSGQCKHTLLEWNRGNHFVDSEIRMAKGFVWTMNNL